MNQELAERMSYHDYLQTDHWKEFRQAALDHYGRKCSYCGRKTSLNVHHLTYERLGCEELSDVTILCKECHMKEHGMYGRICRHLNIVPGSFEVGLEIEYTWICRDCWAVFPGREPTAKELKVEPKRIAKLIKKQEKFEEWAQKEEAKRQARKERRKQKEAAKPKKRKKKNTKKMRKAYKPRKQ
ncbi:MAG: hypothetical protein HPY66_1671 [Firmicutes bacterium]|nr:hypothetical protein [Bacillota bacterium]